MKGINYTGIKKMDLLKEKKAWREESIAKKFVTPFRGFFVFLKLTKHFFFVHLPLYLILIIPGFYFRISSSEWIGLVLAVGPPAAFLAAEDLDVDHRALGARGDLEGGIAHVAGLLAKDRAEKLFLG